MVEEYVAACLHLETVRALRIVVPKILEPTLTKYAELFEHTYNVTVILTPVDLPQLSAEVVLTVDKELQDVSDGWIVDPAVTGDLAARNALAQLNGFIGDDPTIAWADMSMFSRDVSAIFNHKIVGVPLDGDLLLLYYRRDLFESYNLRVPPTWEDFVALARRMNGTDTNGDGVGDLWGVCFDNAPPDCKSVFIFASILAPYVQYNGTSQGMYIDPDSMKPLIDNEATRRAVQHYVDLFAIQPKSMDCNTANTFFGNGSCLMTINFGDEFKASAFVGHDSNRTNSTLGVSRLPGAAQVLNRTTDRLMNCTGSQMCPFAEQTLLADGTTAWVNFAPFSAFGGWTGMVNNHTSATYKRLAYSFFSLVSQPNNSLVDVLNARSGIDPYRHSQMDIRSLDVWTSAGYDPDATRAYLTTMNDALDGRNMVLDMRLRDMSAVTRYVMTGIADNTTWFTAGPPTEGFVDSTLAQGQLKMESTLNSSGDRAGLQKQYCQLIGCQDSSKAKGTRPPSLPGATGGGLSVRETVLVAVLVPAGTLLLAAAVGLVVWRCIVGHRNLLRGAVKAPGAGPQTTLLITDIQDSTSLWEALPEAVMDGALRTHHSVVRKALSKYNGYESATEGDSFILVFHSAADAVACALRVQLDLLAASWTQPLLRCTACDSAGEVWMKPVRGGHYAALIEMLGGTASELQGGVGGSGGRRHCSRVPLLLPRLRDGMLLYLHGKHSPTQHQQKQSSRHQQGQTQGQGQELEPPPPQQQQVSQLQAMPLQPRPYLLGNKGGPIGSSLPADCGMSTVSIAVAGAATATTTNLATSSAEADGNGVQPKPSLKSEGHQQQPCTPIFGRLSQCSTHGDEDWLSGQVHSSAQVPLHPKEAGAYPDLGSTFDKRQSSGVLQTVTSTLALASSWVTSLRASVRGGPEFAAASNREEEADSANGGNAGADPRFTPPDADAGGVGGGGGGPMSQLSANNMENVAAGDGGPGAGGGETQLLRDHIRSAWRVVPEAPPPPPAGPYIGFCNRPALPREKDIGASAVALLSGRRRPPTKAMSYRSNTVDEDGGSASPSVRLSTAAASRLLPLPPPPPPPLTPPAAPPLPSTAQSTHAVRNCPPSAASPALLTFAVPSVEMSDMVAPKTQGQDTAQQCKALSSSPPAPKPAVGGSLATISARTTFAQLQGLPAFTPATTGLLTVHASEVGGSSHQQQQQPVRHSHGPCGTARQLAFRGLRVRMGIHSGLPNPSDVSYNQAEARYHYSGQGMALARAVQGAAAGGQVLLSDATFAFIRNNSGSKRLRHTVVLHMGEHVLEPKLPDSKQVYQALPRQLLSRLALQPPLKVERTVTAGALEAPVGRVAVVFLTVVGASTLLAWNAEATRQALATFQDVFAAEAEAQAGRGVYLVEATGGLLLAAFAGAADALSTCLAVQAALPAVDWPQELLEHDMCEQVTTVSPQVDGTLVREVLFRGLRVKAGVDWGQARAALNGATGRIAYRGRVMNRAARISGKATSGQVLCSRAVWEAASDPKAEDGGPAARGLTALSLGAMALKGISEPVEVLEVRSAVSAAGALLLGGLALGSGASFSGLGGTVASGPLTKVSFWAPAEAAAARHSSTAAPPDASAVAAAPAATAPAPAPATATATEPAPAGAAVLSRECCPFLHAHDAGDFLQLGAVAATAVDAATSAEPDSPTRNPNVLPYDSVRAASAITASNPVASVERRSGSLTLTGGSQMPSPGAMTALGNGAAAGPSVFLYCQQSRAVPEGRLTSQLSLKRGSCTSNVAVQGVQQGGVEPGRGRRGSITAAATAASPLARTQTLQVFRVDAATGIAALQPLPCLTAMASATSTASPGDMAPDATSEGRSASLPLPRLHLYQQQHPQL